MTIKRIGILYHPLIDGAVKLSEELANFLASRRISVWVNSSWEEEKARGETTGTDLLLTVGGDGTILRSAQIVMSSETPIVGINLGRLGFMTELSADEVMVKLPRLLCGEGWIDERAMLEVTLSVSAQRKSFSALNDIVVARGGVARVVSVEVTINGTRLTTYVADGVITATATGSTGYSLSAGGPILHPRAKEFLLLPILPHLCPPYTLVLSDTTVVELCIKTPFAATLSIDGHTNLSIPDGTRVTVRKSPYRTRFLRIHPESIFFSTLEQKLKGRKYAEPDGKSQN